MMLCKEGDIPSPADPLPSTCAEVFLLGLWLALLPALNF